MINTELKNRIKEKVDSIEQSFLLEEILQLIEIEASSNDIFVIPQSHKKELEISLNQMEDGLNLTNELANKRVSEWLLK